MTSLGYGPLAQPGNTLAVKHGAFSDRLVKARTADLLPAVEEMVMDMPASSPAFVVARLMLAQRLARLSLVTDYIDGLEGAVFAEDGMPVPALALEARLRREVDQSLAALGLDVTTASKVGVDLARGMSLTAAVEDALAARDRADRRMAGGAP